MNLLTPPAFWEAVGVTQFEFCRGLWHQKTRVPGLSCGTVCMILRLAVSIDHRLVIEGQTYNDSIYCGSMASHHGKNKFEM